MPELLSESTAAEGDWVKIPSGRNELVAEVPAGDAATVTYEQRIGNNGLAHPVHSAITGNAVSQGAGDPTETVFTPAGAQMRAKRSGGSAAISVKAVPVTIQ